jgi:putative glutathione S-transferase
MGPEGWRFTSSDLVPGCKPEPQFNFKFIKELYFKAEPKYEGRFTVPALWDTKKETFVLKNESLEIIRIFNTAFNSLAKVSFL